MADTQIIIASCTAPGAGALALLRLDGPGACLLAHAMARTTRGNALSTAPSHTIVYGHVIDGRGKDIDQVLFLVMHAPRTFTGNEIVEITCHNNPFIVAAIIARACEIGARQARPGEFTQRALLNGKLDLIQAEALHDLIMAPSRAAAERSLAQLEGSLSRVVADVQEQLVALGAFIEASFEFSEEEHLDIDFDALVREKINHVISFVASILEHQSAAQQLREGAKIALIGTVNAGKSTLLNALVGRKRAIVSDRPGTTRDSIEVGVSKAGYTWTYIDTAGLRETEDVIEQEGIMRSREAAAAADLILLVCDGSTAQTPAIAAEYASLVATYAERMCLVFTKADKGFLSPDFVVPATISCFHMSAKTGDGMEALVEAIGARVKHLYESFQAPFLLNQRQRELLESVQRGLARVRNECAQARPPYELVATIVHDLIALVTELSGRSVTEQVMDAVFSTFCIGK